MALKKVNIHFILSSKTIYIIWYCAQNQSADFSDHLNVYSTNCAPEYVARTPINILNR